MTILSPDSEVHVKIKGFKIFKDRHGKMRCYHRATGEAIDLGKFPIGSTEFLGECGRLAAFHKPSATPRSGSLGLMIMDYKASHAWLDLADKTRDWYEMGFDYLRPINDTALLRFSKPLIIRIRDKAVEKKGWYFGNLIVTTISTVFSWGEQRGLVENNPASGIKRLKRPKDLPRANRPWTDRERFTVLSEVPVHFKPVLAAILYIGADPCDVIKLPNRRDSIEFSRQKTGVEVKQKLKKAFRDILNDSDVHNATTLLANSHGKPWTKSGVDTIWHREKKRMEKEGKISPGLTLKGLRHTHATLLREMGEDDRTIADSLGQETEAMGRHYSRDADVSKKLDRVTQKFNRVEAQKIAKFVKPGAKSVKP
jgi:integrase